MKNEVFNIPKKALPGKITEKAVLKIISFEECLPYVQKAEEFTKKVKRR